MLRGCVLCGWLKGDGDIVVLLGKYSVCIAFVNESPSYRVEATVVVFQRSGWGGLFHLSVCICYPLLVFYFVGGGTKEKILS
jgi:hypothetical protein